MINTRRKIKTIFIPEVSTVLEKPFIFQINNFMLQLTRHIVQTEK